MREKDILSDKEYLGLKTLKRRLQYNFHRFKVPGDFEDFFMSYQMDIVSGYRQHQSLDHFTFDYIRSKIGSTGHKAASSLVLEYREENECGYTEIQHSTLEIVNEIERLTGKIRAAVGLCLLYGLNNPEIGFILEVSESRVNQLLAQYAEGSREFIPFRNDGKLEPENLSPGLRKGRLAKIEMAARILEVAPLWLRNKLEGDYK